MEYYKRILYFILLCAITSVVVTVIMYSYGVFDKDRCIEEPTPLSNDEIKILYYDGMIIEHSDILYCWGNLNRTQIWCIVDADVNNSEILNRKSNV